MQVHLYSPKQKRLTVFFHTKGGKSARYHYGLIKKIMKNKSDKKQKIMYRQVSKYVVKICLD